MARVFLLIAGAIWLAYGIHLMLSPQALAALAGVTATSTTGTIELRAMYGGLVAGAGVLALAGVVAPGLRRAGLAVLAFLSSGLGGTRLVYAALAGEFSRYTLQGLALEFSLAIIALWLLQADFRRRPAAVPAHDG